MGAGQEEAEFVTPAEVEGARNLIERIGAALDVEDNFTRALLANQVTLGRLERRENELLDALRQTGIEQREAERSLLQDVVAQLEDVEAAHLDIVDAIGQIEGIDIETTRRRQRQIEMSRSVPAGTSDDDPVKSERKIPFDGNIVVYTVGWPDGAQNLVGVKLERDGTKLFPGNPDDEYIAANDFTTDFPLVAEVESGDIITSKFINNDATNAHFINAIATVQEDRRR